MEQDEIDPVLEIGQRTSRRHRHLPTSVTSAVPTRSLKGYKHTPLLKMSYRPVEKGEQEGKATGYQKHTTDTYQRRRKHQDKLKERTKRLIATDTAIKNNTKKYTIWCISTLWILFLCYRIVTSMQKENYEQLSVVHFITNIIKSRLGGT
ncbi:hypothetical protein CU098_009691 [Rhizopus stolonifer]|uniref:Uncharacterized protein n=2 Tax=Mucorineae TaxID=1344963 RepID=A0A367K4T1_RHIST|nr:hypothetical protein CU098_009691 [Rhizopus stolonifer]